MFHLLRRLFFQKSSLVPSSLCFLLHFSPSLSLSLLKSDKRPYVTHLSHPLFPPVRAPVILAGGARIPDSVHTTSTSPPTLPPPNTRNMHTPLPLFPACCYASSYFVWQMAQFPRETATRNLQINSLIVQTSSALSLALEISLSLSQSLPYSCSR